MSNYEVLLLFCLAVLTLDTNMEISSLFSWINDSSSDVALVRLDLAIINSHTLISRSSLRQTLSL